MGQPSPAHAGVYDPGDLVTLRATFVSTDMVTPADPSSVAFHVRDPWTLPGAAVVYSYQASVNRLGVGAYAMDLPIPFAASAAGVWNYLARASGGVQAVQPWSFVVATSQII